MNGRVRKTMSEKIELRNPGHVDVTVHLEGEKYVLEARTTHHIEI